MEIFPTLSYIYHLQSYISYFFNEIYLFIYFVENSV